MHKSPFDGSNKKTPPAGPSSATNVREGLPIDFSKFEFKKIGQPPALLQRLSETGADIYMNSERSNASRSPSPDLEDELLISDSPADTLNPGQRPLIARLAMSDSATGAIDNMDVAECMARKNDSPTIVALSQFNKENSSESTGGGHSQSSISKITTVSGLADTTRAPVTHTSINVNNFPSASSSFEIPKPADKHPDTPFNNSNSNANINTNVNPGSYPPVQPFPASSQLSLPEFGTSTNASAASDSEIPKDPSFRELLSQFSSTFLNVDPAQSANIFQLAESSKVQGAEINSSLRVVFGLTQQLSEAMQNCIRLVETFPSHIDMFSSALEKLESQNNRRIDSAKVAVSQMEQRIEIDEQKACEVEATREQERKSIDAMQSSLLSSSIYVPQKSNGADSAPSRFIEKMNLNTSIPDIEDPDHASYGLVLNKLREETKLRTLLDVARDKLASQIAQIDADKAANRERIRITAELLKRKEEEIDSEKAEKVKLLQQVDQQEEQEAERVSSKTLVEGTLSAEKEAEREQSAVRAMEDQEGSRNQALQCALKEQDNKRQDIAEKEQASNQNSSPSGAQRLSKISHGSAPQGRPLIAPSSPPEASNPLLNLQTSGPQPFSVTSSSEVSKNAGARPSEGPRTETSQLTPIPSRNILSHSQSRSAPNASRIVSNGSPAVKMTPSGLPSPPSEVVQNRATEMDPPTSENQKNINDGTRRQKSAKVSQLKTPSGHSTLPAKPLSLPPVVDHAAISSHRQGLNAINSPVLARSQHSPNSPDAQTGNVQSLSEPHGRSQLEQKSIKPDPDDQSLGASERTLSLQKLNALSTKSTSASQAASLGPRVKIETTDDIDIPRLSMPPSPSATYNLDDNLAHLENVAPTCNTASQSTTQPSNLDFQATSTVHSAAASQHIPTEPPVTAPFQTCSNHRSTPIIPANPIPLSQGSHRHVATNDFFDDADSRMGPEIAVSDDWDQPPQFIPVEAESLGQRRRERARPPPNIDHYSPSPPRSRTPHDNPPRQRQSINRRGDHYSPPRSSESFTGPSSRRPHNGSNSRGASPIAQGGNAPSAGWQPNSAQLGRKRLRDDQDHGGPLSRRQRFSENDRTPERYGIGGHTLAPPRQANSDREDWSHVATYDPSPSPEPSRPPVLSSRLEGNDVDRGRRNTGQQINMAQRRQINERTSPPVQNRMSNVGNSGQTNSHQNQNYRESREFNNDPQPHLLSRFTDQGRTIPSEPMQHHSANVLHRPHRGRSHFKQPYPRANHHHQSLEQRMNTNHKGSLIDRIAQGPSGHE